MLKFLVAYPFKREDIVDAGTLFQPNKHVQSMNANLSNMLENHISQFGFVKKGPSKSLSSNGPSVQNSPNS